MSPESSFKTHRKTEIHKLVPFIIFFLIPLFVLFVPFRFFFQGITEFLGVGSEQRTCALRAGPDGARVRFVQRQALTELWDAQPGWIGRRGSY